MSTDVSTAAGRGYRARLPLVVAATILGLVAVSLAVRELGAWLATLGFDPAASGTGGSDRIRRYNSAVRRY